uniref:Uncharacterized protein n=1 Tax=viral metagenome TaxID=1070528 RepID=A0A6C0JXG1_9ZZZZ
MNDYITVTSVETVIAMNQSVSMIHIMELY